jgi:hypothetical protein
MKVQPMAKGSISHWQLSSENTTIMCGCGGLNPSILLEVDQENQRFLFSQQHMVRSNTANPPIRRPCLRGPMGVHSQI